MKEICDKGTGGLCLFPIPKGYDPGLSVASALKLPKDLNLVDSISAAVADADYISLNIPYIKGENGTHGIIGSDVISHFKPNAVLLNFARGELVDSEAIKQFLDAGKVNQKAELAKIIKLHRQQQRQQQTSKHETKYLYLWTYHHKIKTPNCTAPVYNRLYV